MEKEQTVMQRLIAYIETGEYQGSVTDILDFATSLLEAEREQHYKTFIAGSERGTKDIPFNCEQYFDQTYKQ